MIIKSFTIGLYQTNSYVITDESTKQSAIIDPAGASESLDDYIEDNCLCVKYIIFTHGHFDHIAGAFHYSQKYKPGILIHVDDSACLTDENANFTYPAYYDFIPVKPTTLLHDNDVITLGDSKIRVISTPGHTPGGICLLCGDLLVSGDTLFYRSIGRTDFKGGSFSVLKNSVLKLYKLPDNTIVYPGHGCSTILGEEKAENPFVRAE